MGWSIRAAAIFFAGSGVLLALLYLVAHSLIYHPHAYPPNDRRSHTAA